VASNEELVTPRAICAVVCLLSAALLLLLLLVALFCSQSFCARKVKR
tara:strand:- start:275 stop:415 length:141 start_codon:yes stop_codon:yes gene_type:complete